MFVEMQWTSVTKFIVLFLAKQANRYMSQLVHNSVVKFEVLLLITVLLSVTMHSCMRESCD